MRAGFLVSAAGNINFCPCVCVCISMIVRGVGREGDAMDARVLTLVLKSP